MTDHPDPIRHGGSEWAARAGGVPLATRLGALAAMAAIALSACGSAAPASPAASGSPTGQPAATTTASGEPASVSPSAALSGEIKVMSWANGNEQLRMVDEGFKALHPDVKITYIDTSDSTSLELSLSTGIDVPDIIMIGAGEIAKYVDRGVFTDITDQLQPYVSDVPQYLWQAGSRDDRIYWVPKHMNPVVLFYNQPVWEAAGIDPTTIETWDQYLEAGKVIKEKTGVPLTNLGTAEFNYFYGGVFLDLIWQQGAQFTNEAGEVVLDTDPRILRTLEFLGKLVDEGLTVPASEWTDPYYKLLAEGTVASVIEPSYYVDVFKSMIGDEASGKWRMMLLPAWEPGGNRSVSAEEAGMAILSTSQNKDAAWAFLEYELLRPESQIVYYNYNASWPVSQSVAEAPDFAAPWPYFGDQVVGEVFRDAAANVPPPGPYVSDFMAMCDLIGPEIQKYLIGEQSAQEALTSAATQIRETLSRK